MAELLRGLWVASTEGFCVEVLLSSVTYENTSLRAELLHQGLVPFPEVCVCVCVCSSIQYRL